MATITGYTPLYHNNETTDSQVSDENDCQRPLKQNKLLRICAYSLLGVVSAVLLLSLGTLAGQRPSSTKEELHCGNSSTEARARGCVFDLLTNNWMPAYCADPYTDAEYREWVLDPKRHLGSWAYFHDEQGKNQVKSEEHLSDMVGQHIYTTTENHLAHCAFLARRMHRLVTGDIAAVAHNTFKHTIHCTSSLLKSFDGWDHEQVIGSTFDVGIVSCVK
ncbi:hypothetical protein P154DRAFT_447844 [Amniculicola lignicola CBS 123094]|uniref:Uncharacterized protein n=1 Tax=Amniculicola lignicola CBS 123094 TaxID=1392246 RepID=A0A6A5W9M9_9PLEO|nr:hypothetical protein P154DRAFT_447844 [Amniculicola lignicola CBS 123094]